VLAQFLVVDSSADQPIGIVCAYGAELAHGYAYLAVADFRSAERAPLFFDGIAMFIDYLFTTWPLRKLYFESLEFNAEQFASVFVKLFDIEGTLRDHEFFDGRYWDLVVGALYRESWESNGTRFRRMAFGSDRGLDTGEM
jgi:hypothetical protein